MPDDKRFGYYGQIGYHFLPGAFPQFPNSIFTATFRYDFVAFRRLGRDALTLGLNYTPLEDTVLKLDFEKYDQDDDSDGLIFSIATYF